MNTPRISFAVCLLSLAPLGCAADLADNSGDLPIEEGQGDLGKADMISLDLMPLSAAISQDRLVEGGQAIITSANSWENYFGTEAPAEVDFDSQWVAFYGAGTRNTGGYSAEIRAIHSLRDSGGLVLETKFTSPGAGCVVTQAITWPHTLVAFNTPSPAPTWAVHEGSTEVHNCTPTAEELRDQLDASRMTWDLEKTSHGNSYKYSQVSWSWIGMTMETTFVVESGEVVARHFLMEFSFSDDPPIEWTELGADVGSNTTQGHRVATVDDLYEECASDILTRDPQQNEFTLNFDDAGLLRTCQAWPIGCADDCGRGPNLGFINL